MAHFMSDLGQDLQLQGHTIVWDQMVEIVHRLDPLLAIPQLNVTERSLINCQLFGVLRLERRLALDVANLVDAQVKVIGDLPGQPMGIPSIQDRLLDDRPLLICQFLCHVTKLGIDGAQEKEKGMGLHVCGCAPGVTIVPYHGGVASFVNDPAYAVQGYVFSEPIVAQRLGATPRALMVSETGFNPYASVLITTESRLQEQPEMVAAVVAAAQRGWIRYLEQPQQTNEHIHTLNPDMDVEILGIGAELSRNLVITGDSTEKEQIGTMSLHRWRVLVDQMVEAQIIDAGQVSPGSCFATDFLPVSQ